MRKRNGFPGLLAVTAALALVLSPGTASGQSACGGHYTVGPGDRLVAIAARCGVTVPALLAANPAVRHDQDLDVGRAIRIPDPRLPQPSPQQACGGIYTVRPGDTLAGIAQKCGLTVPLLLAANGRLAEPLWTRTGGAIRIPNIPRAAVLDTSTWAATTPAPGVAPEADPAATPEAAPAADLEDLTRATGVLAAGEPCMFLHTDDGETIALVGRPGRVFGPGDRVVVVGVPADAERCGHAPALEARIIHAGAAGNPGPR